MTHYRYVTLEQALNDFANDWISVCYVGDYCAPVKRETE